jgi:hypothetical protein
MATCGVSSMPLGPQWAPFSEFSGIADERLDLPFPGKSELSIP